MLRQQSGVTLIEILIVIVVLGLSLPGILFYFFQYRAGLSETRLRSLASELCIDLMEEIASKKWDENRSTGPVADASKTAAGSLGPEAGESRYNGASSTCFDDMDDYNGFSESSVNDSQGSSLTGFSSFSRSVQVTYVNLSDLDLAVTSTPAPNYKRVRVTVTWGINSVELVGIFSNR